MGGLTVPSAYIVVAVLFAIAAWALIGASLCFVVHSCAAEDGAEAHIW